MKKLLVANRGEISVRIQRSAKALGLTTVAVYSEADADAQHVLVADEAYLLGPAPALQSYLDQDRLIEVARASGADLVHPGYGFLSENAEFAEALAEAGITFVGPSAQAIRAMGSKIEAKNTVAAAGTPVVPGYQGEDQSGENLAAEAQRIGFPLLIKASAGGGGKGMRLVRSADEFDEALVGARREAAGAFGDDAVLLERYLTAPKHIEVQILADTQGNTLHLFERDCSVQRRHQKVIEEAPAPTVDAALRERLGAAAVAAAKSIGYVGAGTVEFIAEGGEFFFMEMNTRLQVEHPVTEAITGLDLVAWQLRIAQGEPLPFAQEDLQISGHAVEARVYAENPRKRFLPSTGTLHEVYFPEDVRVDSGVRSGDAVSMHYDPMLAKVIAHAPTREEAVAKLASALSRSRVVGVRQNVGYLVNALRSSAFADGDYTTGFAEAEHDALVQLDESPFLIAGALAVLAELRGSGPWSAADGFAMNLAHNAEVRLAVGKTEHRVQICEGCAEVDGAQRSLRMHSAPLTFDLDDRQVQAAARRVGAEVHVTIGGDTLVLTDLARHIDRFSIDGATGGGIASPLPGQVLEMRVAAGDEVAAGDVIAIVEAMKMEHTISAPSAGVIRAVHYQAGARVEEGAALVDLEER